MSAERDPPTGWSWRGQTGTETWRGTLLSTIMTYDINYNSLPPVETFSLEEGILQDKPRLLQSTPINDLVTFGENSLEKTEYKLVVKL